MGQEFIIKSQKLEDKVNQLLPSQGGFQAGVDLSASTTVIPIVDLTETAEGSEVRADLQTALSLGSVTAFSINNADTTIVTTTGYYRVFGTFSVNNASTGNHEGRFKLSDGITTKIIYNPISPTQPEENTVITSFDFVVFLSAGDFLNAQATTTSGFLRGCTRQIADIAGNLVDP